MIPLATKNKLKNIPKATILLIVTNVVLYAWGFRSTAFLLSGFAHANISHLLGNMLFLWIFGSYLEDKIGARKFLAFYLLTYTAAKLMAYIFYGGESLGASGAISGIMGLYLVRCRYAKVTTLVPVGLMFFKFNINARWLLTFWILRDIMDAFFAVDNVAHWSHIGGFFAGMVIGYVNSYAAEATKENLYEQAVEAIDRKTDLDNAQANLLAMLKMEPNNPDIHWQLSRLYELFPDQEEKAREHMARAAALYYQYGKSKSEAGEVFHDYVLVHKKPLQPVLHLKYAMTLMRVTDFAGAKVILEPHIGGSALKGQAGERYYLDYIAACVYAGETDAARSAFSHFKKSFPSSLKLGHAVKLIEQKVPPQTFIKEEAPQEVQDRAGWRTLLNEVTSDPLYWVQVTVAVTLGAWSFWAFLACFVLAFVSTAIVRNAGDLFAGLYSGGKGTKSDAEAQRDFQIQMLKNKANQYVKAARYQEAVEHYKKLVTLIPDDIESRFRIAYFSHKKLNRPKEALMHYRYLMKVVPKDYIRRREIYEGFKELSEAEAT